MMKTFKDRQYKFWESVDLAKKLGERIRVRVTPNGFTPEEMAVIDPDEKYAGELYIIEYDSKHNCVDTDHGCLSEDDQIYAVFRYGWSEKDLDTEEVLITLGIEFAKYSWGMGHYFDNQYYFFDKDALLEKCSNLWGYEVEA